MSTTTATSCRGLSIRRMEEETKASEKQGIGSILASEPDRPKTAASLRRTLSADMSSKKWLGRQGVTLFRKIPSSESFPVLPPCSCDSDSSSSSSSSSSASEGEGEEDEQVLRRTRKMPQGQSGNWNSVVHSRGKEEQEKEELEKPRLSDIWGSILSQKADDLTKSSSEPYIHPLVKRSKSSLSQKSLEICTESLGSETGSEGFSPYPPSETGDFEDKLAGKQSAKAPIVELSSPTATPVKQKEELGGAESYNSLAETKKSPPRSFPPPLPSLSRREGPGLLMRSHRRDGRLVLEAVPVSNYNYFHAERQGGRLLLSFINKPSAELMESEDEEEEEEEEVEEMEEEEDDVFDDLEEFEGDEETEKVETERNKVQVERILAKAMKGNQPTLMVTCEVMNLQGQATLSTEKNPFWSHTHKEEEEEELQHLPQSLLPCRVAHLIQSPPPAPPAAAAAAASFSVYDCLWIPKPTVSSTSMQQLPPPRPIMDNDTYYSYYYPNKHNNKIIISNSMGINKPQDQWRNETDCLVPSIRGGCKDSRTKSLFIWQPTSCIATS